MRGQCQSHLTGKKWTRSLYSQSKIATNRTSSERVLERLTIRDRQPSVLHWSVFGFIIDMNRYTPAPLLQTRSPVLTRAGLEGRSFVHPGHQATEHSVQRPLPLKGIPT